MENSFKASAAYDRVVLPDGAIEITYANRHSTWSGLVGLMEYLAMFVVPILFIIGAAGCIFLFSDHKSWEQRLGGLALLLVVGAFIYIGIFARKAAASGKGVIKIVPKVGIQFDGKTLPFKDISRIYTVDREGRDKLKPAFVKCETLGTTVTIVDPFEDATAEFIKNEIVNNSGFTFS